MMTCEIIQGQEKISNYNRIWNELFASNFFEPSTSFYWTHALITDCLDKNKVFLLAILRDSDKITGIIPLVISTSHTFGITLKRLFPISEYYNTHSDILVNKNSTSRLFAALFSAIKNSEQKWDVFEMSRMLETNDMLAAVEKYSAGNSGHGQIRRTEPSYFITLDRDYNEYLKKRSGKFRNFLKRSEKKMTLEGHVEVRHHYDFPNVADAYRELLAIEEKSWKNNHGTAIVSTKYQTSLYDHLCAGADKEGSLHLQFLYLNDKPIAFNLGLIHNDTYYYLKTSYNEEFKHFSPSTVLRAKLVEELIQEKIKYLDFPAEPYEWEQQWADELRWHKSVKIYNHTAKGRLFELYNLLRDKMNFNRLQSTRVNYHDPLDTKPEA